MILVVAYGRFNTTVGTSLADRNAGIFKSCLQTSERWSCVHTGSPSYLSTNKQSIRNHILTSLNAVKFPDAPFTFLPHCSTFQVSPWLCEL